MGSQKGTLARAAEKKGKKVDWDKVNPDIQHVGRHITLPDDPGKMPIKIAIAALQRKAADEEQAFSVLEIIPGFPHDGAVAFVKAMNELYGWASPQTVMTFFGPKPPQMLTIKTGPHIGDVLQCPLGQFILPGVDNPVNTGFLPYEHPEAPGFYVKGEVKKKDQATVLEIVNLARKIVREESIYRGRPIALNVDDDGDLDTNHPPEFMDVSDITENNVLFDADIKAQLTTSILTPIRETEACVRNRIPLRRGILLEGPYGCGKSLAARLTARVAEDNGWTFVLLEKVQGLRAALQFANHYAPAVVFAEDIDRIVTKRDEHANDLINTIDGVLSKTAQVMTVLTTNFVEKLDKAMLRPGRLDAIISIKPPNADTVERLIRFYGGNLIGPNEDLHQVGAELAGQIPASIREAVERAKLGMIGRRDVRVTAQDLVTSAKTMKNHLDLLNAVPNDPVTPAERFAASFREVVGLNGSGIEQLHNAEVATVSATSSVTNRRVSGVSDQVERMDDNIKGIGKLLIRVAKKTKTI